MESIDTQHFPLKLFRDNICYYSSTAACAAANQDLFWLIISYLRKSKVNISYAVLARSANSAS